MKEDMRINGMDGLIGMNGSRCVVPSPLTGKRAVKNKNVRYHYNVMSRGFKAMIVQGFGLRTLNQTCTFLYNFYII